MRRELTIADLGDLVELPLLAVLATYRRDHTVLLSPVWHEWRDGGFDVVTGGQDVKAVHLRGDPRASIVVCEHTPRTAALRCAAGRGSSLQQPATRSSASLPAISVLRLALPTPRR